MIAFKINVLEEMKKKGYPSNVLREKKILGGKTIQKLRMNDTSINASTINLICYITELEIEDIIEYRKDE